MDKKKLVICAMFENMAAHLPEFLAYHRVVGVEHFVLYDNDSHDDPARVIRSSPLAEHVTLIRWPQRPGQLAAYRHFIDIFAPGFEWAAFLEPEDFLLPLTGRSVMDTLSMLGSASAVVVARRVFAPAPAGGLAIERHARRAPDDFPGNRHVRVIARCSDLLDIAQVPHAFRVTGAVFDTAGHLAANAAIQGAACHENLVVNHYPVGPQPAWFARVAAEIEAAGGVPVASEAQSALLVQVPDTAAQAFAPAVRALLGLAPAEGPAAGVAPDTAALAAPPPPIPPAAAPALPATPVPLPALPAFSFVPPEAAPAPPPLTPEPLQFAPVAAAVTEQQVFPPEPRDIPAEPPLLPTEPPFIPAEQHGMSWEPPAAATQMLQTPAPSASPTPAAAPALVSGIAAPVRADVAPGWVATGPDAQERTDQAAFVFRDGTLPGEHWLAGLRGAATTAVTDPAFITDEYDRIRDFPSAAEARAACDTALAPS